MILNNHGKLQVWDVKNAKALCSCPTDFDAHACKIFDLENGVIAIIGPPHQLAGGMIPKLGIVG